MSDEQLWCFVADGLIHCGTLTPGTDEIFATNYFTANERAQSLMQVLSEPVPTDGEWKGPDFVNESLCLYQEWVNAETIWTPWNQRSSLECEMWKICPDCVAHQDYYHD